MIKKFFAVLLVFTLILNTNVKADGDDEGMWLPMLVQKLNMQKMQAMGLKLTAEDIYSVNKGSLKDAVIALDHGSCTGELVSPDGLFLTNHHCGYGEIQAHSTVEHDYLTDGFWAMSREEELPNPGKTVSFLISVEDVTDKVNEVVNDEMSEKERETAIMKLAAKLEKAAVDNSKEWYEAKMQPFFEGNSYYLFVYETFMDVRLVGAPPSSIGKYGADTDNWMWPRHTGDFSMFRIYCAPDGKPAEYSEENVPFHPKKFFPVSVKGTKKNDFAMVMGYPGSTTRYMTSWGVDQEMKNTNAIRIKLRGIKQDIMKKEMNASDKVRIQYASKYSRSTNYYKYSIGQNKGLKALNVVAKKQKGEAELEAWINKKKKRKEKYGEALPIIKKLTKELDEANKVQNYWVEAFWLGPECIKAGLRGYYGLQRAAGNEEAMKEFKEKGKDFFKDYYQPIDKEMFIAMCETYKEDINPNYYPSFFKLVDTVYSGDFSKYADYLYSTSVFVDEDRFNKFMENVDLAKLEKDPAVVVANSVYAVYTGLQKETEEKMYEFDKGKRKYLAALLEKEKDVAHYPDANSTMRFTYGSVGDYSPMDAVIYKHYTTLKGYMEKEKEGAPKTDEFYVPQKLKDLYAAKDYGQYADISSDGKKEMRVCFTTNNDITGGNSGSPVINGNGELIGIAFDGNWEAMSGDIAFETELQKCINVDIRFVLFVIDKYAGAKHLIDEMTIVK
ncbi:MAG: S46 family peptidase [Bacteroidales bacterium]|nr:S46 family peptidase [Bacteroidales bacterium]